MIDTTLQLRQDIRGVRRALIARAAQVARELSRDVEADKPPQPNSLAVLAVLESQISFLSRLIREIEDFDAV